MGNRKLKDSVYKILKQEPKLWNEERGELNQTLLFDVLESLGENKYGLYEFIIESFLEDTDLRNQFFLKVKDVYVFRANDFKFFMEENKVHNSFTQYKNRIGLTDGKRFLKDSSDVVLDFPYKDCILEGGQRAEDSFDEYYEYDEVVTKAQENKGLRAESYNLKATTRREVFFNQVIAKDEIDRLFDKKAFINWRRFNEDGETSVEQIKRNADGTIMENLLIKGNNLLVLHSIKNQFAGKVKLIYIDPPYNTGSDSFSYNDRFNHSSWLTFMKNRLEVAKELLKDDGVIFVQCDDNEQAYLNILMAEIFGRENFINLVAVKAKSSAGASGGGEDRKLKKNYENLIIYSNKNFKGFKKVYENDFLEDIIRAKTREKKSFEYHKILISTGDKVESTHIETGKKEKIKVYKHSSYEIVSVKEIAKRENLELMDVYKKYFSQIFRTQDAQSSIRHKVVSATNKEGGLYSITYIPTSGKNRGKETELFYFKNEMVNFLTNTVFIEDNNLMKKTIVGSLWKDIAWDGIANEGGVKLKFGKKPEKLLERIIEMTTEPGDIVLDYHLGSGTTCAVAHKMRRQYIGVEQLNYDDNDSLKRLQNVINGDKTGISKRVDWRGGSDFIYCELAQFNENAKEEINDCRSLKELEDLFDILYIKYFLNYNVKVKEFKEKIIQEDNFKALKLEEQKLMFLSMLDLNQMYVLKSEMEDEKYAISMQDQKLTKDFYKNND